jgi:quinol monooxygenase YgiN
MAIVSVTRLQLRSLRYLPLFMWHVFASTRQVRHAPGFLGGQLANEGTKGFWTITAWRDEAAMRAYRNAAAHRRAMPHLLQWCDEASVVHWQQEQATLPDLTTACQRMEAEGRLSKVRYPSPRHAAKQIMPRQTPRAGLPLRPTTAEA